MATWHQMKAWQRAWKGRNRKRPWRNPFQDDDAWIVMVDPPGEPTSFQGFTLEESARKYAENRKFAVVLPPRNRG